MPEINLITFTRQTRELAEYRNRMHLFLMMLEELGYPAGTEEFEILRARVLKRLQQKGVQDYLTCVRIAAEVEENRRSRKRAVFGTTTEAK